MKIIDNSTGTVSYNYNAEHIKNLFDAVASGILILSSSAIIEHINSAACKMLGLSDADLEGQSYDNAKFMALDESGSPLDFYSYPSQITFRTGESVKERIIGIVLSDKMSYNWYVVSTKPLYIEKGSPHQVVVTITPITGKGEIEEALRKSEEKFRSLVTSMEDTVFTLDKDLVHTGMYGKWMKKHNINPDFYIGRSVREVFGELSSGHEEVCYEVLKTGTTKFFEWNRSREGCTFYYQALISPLKTFEGNVYGIVGVSRDVTEQKQMELGLLESEERFRQFAENANDVFWMRDSATCDYIYLSPSFKKLWGLDVSDIFEKRKTFYDTVFPDDMDRISDTFESVPETEYEIEYRIVKPDGEIRWVRSRAFPIFNEQGAVWRVAGIVEDITDLRDKEELLRKSDKLAVVGELAAGIAHEIRNPLTSIKGFIQLIKPDIREHISEIILSELDRIESIINEFLILAKPHSDMDYKWNDINQFIRQTIVLLDSEANLNNVQFDPCLTEHLPLVRSEGNQIKQVLINVIKNAIEAMSQGGTIKIKTSMQKEEFVCLTIQDEGIGISEERLNRLGEPFYSNKEKGIGLGLMVSLKIIENHKGTITFSSKINEGTTVTILLPVAKK
ncbi:PAS domain S-box protein [Fictibacillus sp. B-59209]|uniref:PAS domain S-box protein n=1 Tax=Fictibacillus sp. B-59209 TaxID=3024873 RepID=UPI002E2424AD|nr:PAS domain S-box protein [Fictibacillus sp. B-59209]